MFIPPGYANIQWIMQHTNTAQIALTAIGVEIEAADPQVVVEGATAAFDDNFGELCGLAWAGLTVRMVIGTSDPSAPITLESPTWQGGSAAGNACPAQVCTLLKKITLSGGRKGKGRMYLPGPLEGSIDDAGHFTTTQSDDNQARATAFRGDMIAIAGVTSVVLLHTDPADEPSEIVGILADPVVGSQRRRLR